MITTTQKEKGTLSAEMTISEAQGIIDELDKQWLKGPVKALIRSLEEGIRIFRDG